MRRHSDNRKMWLVMAVVVIAVVVVVLVVWPHLRGPVPVPSEEMPEALLPSDPQQAEIEVRERAVQDKLRGLDEEACQKRHQARLKQLEEIRRRAAGSSQPAR